MSAEMILQSANIITVDSEDSVYTSIPIEGERIIARYVRAGKYADLVIWGKTPVTADPDEMRDIKVEATLADGKWVYKA